MAKKDKQQTIANAYDLNKVEAEANNWFHGNADKNAGAKIERKAKEALESELANTTDTVVVKIADRNFLEIGFVDEDVEEIDPKKFMENHPDLFWELVSVPKTAVQAKLGDKEVALNSRIVTKHSFKISKHKSDPRQ